MSNKQINIAIADDHNVVREAMKTMLESEKSISVLFDVGNGRELLDKLAETKPDIIILDIEMPLLSGRDVLKTIKQRYSKIKVIVLTSHYQDEVIIDFIKMGASAFLPKDCTRSKLIEAILTVSAEGNYFDRKVSEVMAKELIASGDPKKNIEKIKFNDTELAIVRMICQGKINKEIAEALSLSTRTIEWHRLNIMNALRTKDVDDLILYAIQNKLVTLV